MPTLDGTLVGTLVATLVRHDQQGFFSDNLDRTLVNHLHGTLHGHSGLRRGEGHARNWNMATRDQTRDQTQDLTRDLSGPVTSCGSGLGTELGTALGTLTDVDRPGRGPGPAVRPWTS